MKKIIALLLALVMALSLAACAGTASEPTTEATTESTPETTTDTTTEESTDTTPVSMATTISAEDVMSYEEFVAAELETEVVVETQIQGKQSWWQDEASFYTQDGEGAYFIYKMPCSEADYAELTNGTWIRVKGFKIEWAGEVEIGEAEFEIIEKDANATQSVDISAMLGTEELINYQNQRIFLKDAVVVASTNTAGEELPFLYSWDGSGEAGSDADLYFNVEVNGVTQTLVFEYYMCDEEGNYGDYNDTYNNLLGMKIGDKMDVHGFLYWYEGAQPHVTSVMFVG